MKNKLIRRLKNYLSAEIAIEYKACLYFFAILFFYSCFLALRGVFQAGLLHMCEMILTAYLVGYLQVYVLGNFDEAERLGKREVFYILLCTSIYTGVSWLWGWFDKSPAVTAGFAGYIAFAYWCAYLVNRIKREIDTEKLNQMLTKYKEAETGSCEQGQTGTGGSDEG